MSVNNSKNASYTQEEQKIAAQLSTVSEWLSWMNTLHHKPIDLDLSRVKQVAERLNIKPVCPVVTVGGTNGKGSTVAALEAIYRAAGFQTGAFTSPFLKRFNEEIRINGNEVSDAELCHAFQTIERMRDDISLTPFEFQTLAALLIFKNYALHIWLLEIGLGGRKDAVNIIDADVAIVTSIGIDHVEWLGNTRESIAYEKAGIYRAQQSAICGDFHPPHTLIDYAKHIQANFFQQGKDFYYQENNSTWSWCYQDMMIHDLPFNDLLTQNMSTVLMAIHQLQKKLFVANSAIRQGLKNVKLLGRMQIIPNDVMIIFDVAHNVDAVKMLAQKIKTLSSAKKTVAVFSMLADKDIQSCILQMIDQVDEWLVAPVQSERATSLEKLQHVFFELNIQSVRYFTSIHAAVHFAKNHTEKNDRIIVFGSFRTVAESYQVLSH